MKRIILLTVMLLLPLSVTYGVDPADMVPTGRPRLILSPDDLAQRIAWVKPGGPLRPHLDGLMKTITTDHSWNAWHRAHAALVYLLTGEEAFARRAWEPRGAGQMPIESVLGDVLIYDWLVAGDAHWKQQAFPDAERKKFEAKLARHLRGAPGRVGQMWTPDYPTLAMAERLSASRALLGVPEFDADARVTFNACAGEMVDHFWPAWNVCGGFKACGPGYGDGWGNYAVFATAMMDGLAGRYDPWTNCRYAKERVLQAIALDIPHLGKVEGLGGLPEPHGDVNGHHFSDRWSLPILTRAYRDPLGQWYLRNVYPTHTRQAYWTAVALLALDPRIKPVGPTEAGLPLASYTPWHQRYGQNPNAEGSGQVIMRSRWGDPDATFLYFRGGDFFDGHQDVGNLHFSLYRKGYFAVEAASRHTYDGCRFREIIRFHHTSLARNTIQIYDTDMPHGHGGWGGWKPTLDGTQNMYAQRGYREGGHIQAFETNDDYSYISADATPMYQAMYPGNPKRDRAREVRRQLVYVRSRPAGSDDVLIVFDRVDETPENFAVQSSLKLGGVSKRWVLNVATTPRHHGERLEPGIQTFDTEGPADTYTLPAGGIWPGDENGDAQCHVQVLLPRSRTVRWVGGIDPAFDVPSTNLVPGLYYIRLVCQNEDELRKHPAYIGGSSRRYTRRGNVSGRIDTLLPIWDPNIKRHRCAFYLSPAMEAAALRPGESVLWQARVTPTALTILRNGKPHAEYPFEEHPTVGAIEKAMHATLRTPGNPEPWHVVLIRGYEWWGDNWQFPNPKKNPEAQGFVFDEPEKVTWPIVGGAMDSAVGRNLGGIYAKAYPNVAGEAPQYSQSIKQICGLWRMETMAGGGDIQPRVHFLHVLSPVDAGVPAPESSVVETEDTATVTVRTARGRQIVITFNKLGLPAGGSIRLKAGDAETARKLTDGIDLTGADREALEIPMPVGAAGP